MLVCVAVIYTVCIRRLVSMRSIARVFVAVLAVVVTLPVSVAVGAARPVVVRPSWRVVVSGELLYAGADDRYVAIVHGYAGGGQLTIIDEQTGQGRTLTPPNCSRLDSADGLQFGGPWLMVGCGGLTTPDLTYLLYDLRSSRWTPFAISAQCSGFCRVVGIGRSPLCPAFCRAGIGRYWVMILSNDQVMNYSPDVPYLQNLQTGSFVPDPASPGGRIYDDLSAPSGSTPLCSPLRYPTIYNGHDFSPQLGTLAFYAGFALVADQHLLGTPPDGELTVTSLQRCHSRLKVTIPASGSPDPNSAPIVASSGAVILSPNGKTLDGWRLPGLQRFILSPPAETQVGPCGVLLPNAVIPVALTAHTIYVRALCGARRLWAARLPSAASLERCIVPNLKNRTLASARAAIRAAHCRIGTVAHAYSTRIATGRVISQKPPPGTVRTTGTRVRLVLSRGKRR